MTRHAFTLVELLVVITIIDITDDTIIDIDVFQPEG